MDGYASLDHYGRGRIWLGDAKPEWCTNAPRCSWKYGFKGIKSIVKISFVEKQPPSTWSVSTPREYGFYSNVNPEVDHPRWSQKRERRLPGKAGSQPFLPKKIGTKMFNGCAEEVAGLCAWYGSQKELLIARPHLISGGHVAIKRSRPFFKTCVFLGLIPFGWLAFALWSDTVNATVYMTADPVQKLNRELGDWALIFIIITIAVRPLMDLTKKPGLVAYRRA